MPDYFLTASRNIQKILSQGQQLFFDDFFKLIMFLVSNNLFGSTAQISAEVYGWMQHCSDSPLLAHLFPISPTSDALIENLFRLAIDAEDAATLRKILNWGFDFSEQVCHSSSGRKLTPLQRACVVNSIEIVQLLLEAGADVTSTLCPTESVLESVLECADRSSEACLEYNRKEDLVHAELIRILLHAGAKANTKHGASALCSAARFYQVKTVALLVAAGADVNITGIDGKSPLFHFAQMPKCSHSEDVVAIVRKLIQAGADIQATATRFDEPESVLEVAIRSSRIEIIQLLLDGGAVITESAFIAAFLVEGDEENSTTKRVTLEKESCVEDMVKLLLRFGASVTHKVIGQAVESANTELLFFLIGSVKQSSVESLVRTAFIMAIHDANMEFIGKLDSLGVSLTSTRSLEIAMAKAAGRGDIRVFQWLLGDRSRHRATVINSLGMSLYPAIANGRKGVTKLLLEAGAEVNEKSKGLCYSPLIAAICQEDAQLAQKLMAAGAEVNEYSLSLPLSFPHVQTVLPSAVKWGYRPLILDMISAGADISAPQSYEAWGKTALTVAVEKRDEWAVQTLIEAGSDVNAPAAIHSGRTALVAAVRNNDIAMVGYLLGIGAHLDEGSLFAAVTVNVELMQLLLAAHPIGCQRHPMGYGCAALQHAVELKKNVMVETLLASSIGTNTLVPSLSQFYWYIRSPLQSSEYLESAFGTAIRTDGGGDQSIVRMLLRGGANPNGIVIKSPNKTALLAGIDQNNLPLVSVLIEAGADVNAVLSAGISRTPLQRAAEEGRMEMVRTVLEHGADANAPPFHRFGATALQFAAMGGYVGIACLLLERGAEINAEPAKIGGRTALEGAAEHGRIDMLQLLLSAGALIVGPGAKQYERARELATENGYIAARRLLESYHTQLLEGFASWDRMATNLGVLDELQF
jgi:ankyrin repeat protein